MISYDKSIKIRIDSETLEELKILARINKVKTSEFVRQLIYRELRKNRDLIKEEKEKALHQP
jgi:metal-responsive CopG/Arc/MetJ family transcriptional regulator